MLPRVITIVTNTTRTGSEDKARLVSLVLARLHEGEPEVSRMHGGRHRLRVRRLRSWGSCNRRRLGWRPHLCGRRSMNGSRSARLRCLSAGVTPLHAKLGQWTTCRFTGPVRAAHLTGYPRCSDARVPPTPPCAPLAAPPRLARTPARAAGSARLPARSSPCSTRCTAAADPQRGAS